MGADSKIEWTHHTFNPWWGCTRVSPGCEHCYAETFAKRVGVKWGVQADRRVFADKHWAEPIKWNRSAGERRVRERVFCASMADVFEDRPELTAERAKLLGARGTNTRSCSKPDHANYPNRSEEMNDAHQEDCRWADDLHAGAEGVSEADAALLSELGWSREEDYSWMCFT